MSYSPIALSVMTAPSGSGIPPRRAFRARVAPGTVATSPSTIPKNETVTSFIDIPKH